MLYRFHKVLRFSIEQQWSRAQGYPSPNAEKSKWWCIPGLKALHGLLAFRLSFSTRFCLQGLQVVQCLRSTSVTRRAAGLPMLILCILSAEEASKARPLLAHSMQTLLETARSPLNDDWDQTLDLPQVRSYRGKMLVFVIKKDKTKNSRGGGIIVLSSYRCVQCTPCKLWCGARLWEQLSFSLRQM